MIQFDEHIFQMGWFNHQPGMLMKHLLMILGVTYLFYQQVMERLLRRFYQTHDKCPGEPNTATHWRMFQVTWKNDKDLWITLQKFNSSPLKSYLPNRKLVFQPPFFRGYVELWWGRIRFWSRIESNRKSPVQLNVKLIEHSILQVCLGIILKDVVTFGVPSLKLQTSKSQLFGLKWTIFLMGISGRFLRDSRLLKPKGVLKMS